MLKIKDFQKLIDIYGGDFARWPDDRAVAAKTLMEQSQQARMLYRDAGALDRMLDMIAVPPVPEGLAEQAAVWAMNRPVSAAPRRPARKAFDWHVLMPAGAFAAAALAVLLMLPGNAGTSADVNVFLQTMDQQASATFRDLKETDDMLSMLEPADGQSDSSDGDASDDMIHILFSDDKSSGG